VLRKRRWVGSIQASLLVELLSIVGFVELLVGFGLAGNEVREGESEGLLRTLAQIPNAHDFSLPADDDIWIMLSEDLYHFGVQVEFIFGHDELVYWIEKAEAWLPDLLRLSLVQNEYVGLLIAARSVQRGRLIVNDEEHSSDGIGFVAGTVMLLLVYVDFNSHDGSSVDLLLELLVYFLDELLLLCFQTSERCRSFATR